MNHQRRQAHYAPNLRQWKRLQSIDSPFDTVEWAAVLKSFSGFEMYRKQFHRANCRNVTQFLILDQEFPASIRFCIQTASRSLRHIACAMQHRAPASEEMNILLQSLEQSSIDSILQGGLHEFVDTFQYNLNVVDEAICRSFFPLEDQITSTPKERGLRPCTQS